MTAPAAAFAWQRKLAFALFAVFAGAAVTAGHPAPLVLRPLSLPCWGRPAGKATGERPVFGAGSDAFCL